MPQHLAEVTDGEFEAQVLQSEKLVVVDFWAPWCGPCKAIGPILEELSGQFDGQVKFFKCNVDNNPSTPSEFGIRAIPNLMVFKDGKLVDQITGVVPRVQIEQTIRGALEGAPAAMPFVMQ